MDCPKSLSLVENYKAKHSPKSTIWNLLCMIMLMKKFIALLLGSFALTHLQASPNDSIGNKTVDGKYYVLHKVVKGEGVYGISKKYGVTADDVFAANEGSKNGIKIDQVLMIPKKNQSITMIDSIQSEVLETTTTKTEKIYHTVSKGQTLSLIAKQHHCSVQEIKTWNKLKSDNIQLGQKLEVGQKTIVVKNNNKPNTPNTPSKPAVVNTPVPSPDKPIIPAKEPIIDHKNVVIEPTQESPLNTEVNTSYNTVNGDELTEQGNAIISNEGELNQDRSFILHPSAKIGTIVMITNPSNNNTVFARVVGNYKADNISIFKMSKSLATKLGLNSSAQVKISYAK